MTSRSVGIAGATVGVSVAGLLRESSVASALGLGRELDGLVTAMGLLLLVGSAMITTASSALLPEMTRRLRGAGGISAQELAGSTLAVAIVLGLAFGAGLSALASVVAETVAGGDRAAADAVADVLRITAAPIVAASAVRGVLIVLLQAADSFVLPAGIQVISSGSMATAALLLDSPSAVDLASWFALGLGAESFVLGVAAWRSARPRVPLSRRRWSVLSPLAPRAGYSLAAAVVFGLNPVIDYAVANHLDEGSAGQLAIAARIPLAAAALLVAVVVTPAYPEFAESYGVGGREAVFRRLRPKLRETIVLGTAGAVGVALLSFPAALIFFARGELSTDDANRIATTQIVYALTIPPYVAGVLSSRALLAADRQRLQLVGGLIGAGLNLVLDVILGQIFGVNGIAAATVGVYATTFWWMYYMARAT